MTRMLSVLAASALFAAAGSAYAACGHQSAGIEQTVASAATTTASEDEAASTFDPQTVKKPVEETVKEEAAE